MKNALNWFEIPAKNFEALKGFYEAIFETTFQTAEMPEMGSKMAFFPSDWTTGVGGSVISGPGHVPAQNGSLVYLNRGKDLSAALARAEKAGATILLPKTAIGENGFVAQFIDPDGNRVAFHSRN